MSDKKPTPAEIYAMAVAQVHIGVAMARASGVVCGSPINIRVISCGKAK